MNVYNKIRILEQPVDSKPCVLAIGNFDGLHIGHQALFNEIKYLAKQKKLYSAVLTFDPRPEAFFQNRYLDQLLFTPSQKLRAFEEMELDFAYVQNFDRALSELSPEEFVTKILLEKLQARVVVVGQEFRFGHKRSGDVALLEKLLKPQGCEVVSFSTVNDGAQKKIGSRAIRELIANSGDMLEVTRALGRPYLVEGLIVEGKKIGRTISFPTMNLKYEASQLIPKVGVYSGYIHLGEGRTILRFPAENIFKAVFNIGYRPTVGENLELKVEGHIFDKKFTSRECYGDAAGFYFERRIRNEKKFDSLEELKLQIVEDVKGAH